MKEKKIKKKKEKMKKKKNKKKSAMMVCWAGDELPAPVFKVVYLRSKICACQCLVPNAANCLVPS